MESDSFYVDRQPQEADDVLGEGKEPSWLLTMSESFAELFEQSFASQQIKARIYHQGHCGRS